MMKKRLNRQKTSKKQQKNKQAHKKQKAFKQDIQKVVDKAKNILLPKDQQNDDIIEDCTIENASRQTKKQSEASMSFFYTSDKYFMQFDDAELILAIQQKYPEFMDDSTEDSAMKKIIVQIIQDKHFVLGLLDAFNMNIQEFFKFIFRSNLAIFKGPFLNKLHRILIDNKYDI